jgi:hypothetical protein
MKMIKNPDKNSHVKAYGYNPETKIMRVEFTGNKLYDYPNAEASDFDALVNAQSKGSHVHTVIKEQFSNPTKLSRHETTEKRVGYLIEDEKIESLNRIHSDVDSGHCPACGKKAEGWEPPVNDVRYLERRNYEKTQIVLESKSDVTKIDVDKITDREADLRFLRSNGYIETCENCRTAFFIPRNLAQLKEAKVE